MRNLLLTAAISCALISCGGNNNPATLPAAISSTIITPVVKTNIPRDSVIRIVVSQDTTQTYHIYYPKGAGTVEVTTLLLCFDPHGGGRIPIDKYRHWADQYKVAIAGSNSSRNGLSLDEGQQIANNMANDIINHLGFTKPNIALCGFSGGAKVALSASGSTGIDRVIYAGAATPVSSPLLLLGFAGQQDMNYTDLLQFYESTQATDPSTALIEFSGKHEWPDAATFEDAFYWLVFQTQRQNTDAAITGAFVKKSNDNIARDRKKNDWLMAYQDCHNAYIFLNGITDVSAYKTQLQSIAADDQYKKALAQKNDILQKEAGQKQVLLQAFQNQNNDWWTRVINQFKASTDPSDKRLLGFISLACYSYSNQMIQQRNTAGAERILAIYELCDATNTDQLYFHAILYAQENNNAMALKYLNRAVSNGYTDRQKLETDPAFSALRGDPAFGRILASLSKSPK